MSEIIPDQQAGQPHERPNPRPAGRGSDGGLETVRDGIKNALADQSAADGRDAAETPNRWTGPVRLIFLRHFEFDEELTGRKILGALKAGGAEAQALRTALDGTEIPRDYPGVAAEELGRLAMDRQRLWDRALIGHQDSSASLLALKKVLTVSPEYGRQPEKIRKLLETSVFSDPRGTYLAYDARDYGELDPNGRVQATGEALKDRFVDPVGNSNGLIENRPSNVWVSKPVMLAGTHRLFSEDGDIHAVAGWAKREGLHTVVIVCNRSSAKAFMDFTGRDVDERTAKERLERDRYLVVDVEMHEPGNQGGMADGDQNNARLAVRPRKEDVGVTPNEFARVKADPRLGRLMAKGPYLHAQELEAALAGGRYGVEPAAATDRETLAAMVESGVPALVAYAADTARWPDGGAGLEAAFEKLWSAAADPQDPAGTAIRDALAANGLDDRMWFVLEKIPRGAFAACAEGLARASDRNAALADGVSRAADRPSARLAAQALAGTLDVRPKMKAVRLRSPDRNVREQKQGGIFPFCFSGRAANRGDRSAAGWTASGTDLFSALTMPGITVVEAEGGSGKSSLLHEIARAWLSNGCRIAGPGKTGGAPSPVQRLSFLDLHGLRIDANATGMGAKAAVLAAARNADLLLLDGLEEANWRRDGAADAAGDLRSEFSKFLHEVAAGKKTDGRPVSVVIASRPGHFDHHVPQNVGQGEKPVDVRAERLNPFHEKDVDAYVRSRFVGHARERDVLASWERARKSKDQIVTEAVRHPLTLALMCEAADGGEARFEEFARNRFLLCETVAKLLLNLWEHAPHKSHFAAEFGPENTETILDALGAVANAMGRGTLHAEDIAKLLPKNCLTYLRQVSAATGAPLLNPLQLLAPDAGKDGQYSFKLDIFREHFTLRHLRSAIERGKDACPIDVLGACGHSDERLGQFAEFPGMSREAYDGWLSRSCGAWMGAWPENFLDEAECRDQVRKVATSKNQAGPVALAWLVATFGTGEKGIGEEGIARMLSLADGKDSAAGIVRYLEVMGAGPSAFVIDLLDRAVRANPAQARAALKTWFYGLLRLRDMEIPSLPDETPDSAFGTQETDEFLRHIFLDRTEDRFMSMGATFPIRCLRHDPSLADVIWKISESVARAGNLWPGKGNKIAMDAALRNERLAERYLNRHLGISEKTGGGSVLRRLAFWKKPQEPAAAMRLGDGEVKHLASHHPGLAGKVAEYAGRSFGPRELVETLGVAVKAKPSLASRTLELAISRPDGETCQRAWDDGEFLSNAFQGDPKSAGVALTWLERHVGALEKTFLTDFGPLHNLRKAVFADPSLGKRALSLILATHDGNRKLSAYDRDSIMRRRTLENAYPADEARRILCGIVQIAAEHGNDVRDVVEKLGCAAFGPLYPLARLYAGESTETAIRDADLLELKGWPLWMQSAATYDGFDPVKIPENVPSMRKRLQRDARAQALLMVLGRVAEKTGPEKALKSLRDWGGWDWVAHLGAFNQAGILATLGEMLESYPDRAADILETAVAIGTNESSLLWLLEKIPGRAADCQTTVSGHGDAFGTRIAIAHALVGNGFPAAIESLMGFRLAGLPLYEEFIGTFPRQDPAGMDEKQAEKLQRAAHGRAISDFMDWAHENGRLAEIVQSLRKMTDLGPEHENVVLSILHNAAQLDGKLSAAAFETALRLGVLDGGKVQMPPMITTEEAARLVVSSTEKIQDANKLIELLGQSARAAPALVENVMGIVRNSKHNLVALPRSHIFLEELLKANMGLRAELIGMYREMEKKWGKGHPMAIQVLSNPKPWTDRYLRDALGR